MAARKRKRRRAPRWATADRSAMAVILGTGYAFFPEMDCFHGDRDAMHGTWLEAEADGWILDYAKDYPFKRPWAWWQWSAEAKEPRKEGETQRAYLVRRGLLTDHEKRVLAAEDQTNAST